LYQLGLMAKAENDTATVTKISQSLSAIDPDFAEDYDITVGLIAPPAP
jgi:hypothetical protein